MNVQGRLMNPRFIEIHQVFAKNKVGFFSNIVVHLSRIKAARTNIYCSWMFYIDGNRLNGMVIMDSNVKWLVTDAVWIAFGFRVTQNDFQEDSLVSRSRFYTGMVSNRRGYRTVQTAMQVQV